MGHMEALGFPLRQEAQLQTLTSDVLKSSEIEGETLDAEQVRSSIARRLGMDIGALKSTDRNVEGIVEMMLDATLRYSEPLSSDRLFAWHASLFPTGRSGMTRIRVGNWRDDATGRMQVISGPIGKEHVHFEAPTAARLDGEMQAFLDWFNATSQIDPVLKAGVSHLWFVTIHPFDDGNGALRAPSRIWLWRALKTARSAFTACRHKSERSVLPITTSLRRRRKAQWTLRPGSIGS
jgi:Fic family protein